MHERPGHARSQHPHRNEPDCGGRTRSRRLALPGVALAAALFWVPLLGAQTPVGVLTEERDGPLLEIELDQGASLRRGAIAHVVYWDDAAQSWIPKAEVAVERVLATRATVRILQTPSGLVPEAGDRVVVYEAPGSLAGRLRVTPGQHTLLRGQSVGLLAELVDGSGSVIQRLPARWRASDPDVVHVASDGRVYALRAGETVVVAQGSAGLAGLAYLRVEEPEFTLPDSLTTFVGVEAFVPIRARGGASTEGLQWTVRDPQIARIHPGGRIEPRVDGITEVRVQGLNLDRRFPLRVHGAPAEVRFTPDTGDASLLVGQVLNVRASVLLEDGTVLDGLIPSLEVSDPLLLEPVSAGTLLSLREGDARITAQIAGAEARWTARVAQPSLSVALPSAALPMGELVQPTAFWSDGLGGSLGPASEATWVSLDPDVVTVRDGFLQARQIGRATIRASAGGQQATAQVYVLGDLLVSVGSGRSERIRTLTLDDGRIHDLPSGSPRGSELVVSPRGDLVAFVKRTGLRSRVHVMRPDGSGVRAVTPPLRGPFGLSTGLYREHRPAFSPDGETLYFLANPRGNYSAWGVDLETGQVWQVADGGHHFGWLTVDPVTHDVILERTRGSEASDLMTVRPDGTGLTRIFNGNDPAWAPFLYERPIALGEGSALVARRTLATLQASGDELVLVRPMSALRGERAMVLVPAEPRQRVTHAVSPSTGYLAFLRVSPGRGDARRLFLYNLERSMVRPIELEGGYRVSDLAWVSERPSVLQRVTR